MDRKYHQRVVERKDDYDWHEDVDEYFLDKEMGLASKE